MLHTAHGTVDTPTFMPVGTAGPVKAMTADAVRATGAGIVLGNTYHLMLRPTAERIADAGRVAPVHGLARSDPDGFRRVPGDVAGEATADRRGRRNLPVAYRRLDASADTVDRSMEIQRLLGATVTMAFDECTPFPATEEQVEASMRLTTRWAASVRGGLVLPAPRLRAIRHRARWRISGAALGIGTRAAGDRFRRIRDWPSRSGKARRRCSLCWITPCHRCPQTGRAI